MILTSKYFFLVPLLAAFSAGLPSPVEDDKAASSETSPNTYNINIVINCYFNSNSPECKDDPKEAVNTRPSDDIGNDDDGDRTSEDTVQVDDGNLEDVSQVKDIDYMPADQYRALVERSMPSGYETASDSGRYEDMSTYSSLWLSREKTRDTLCMVCLAIASDENFLLDPLQRPEFEKNLTWIIRKNFIAVKTQLDTTKRDSGMSLNRPVPFERGYESCSSVVQQILYDRATLSRQTIKREREYDVNSEEKLEFYGKFIKHMEDDPLYMKCGPLDEQLFAQLRDTYEFALQGIP